MTIQEKFNAGYTFTHKDGSSIIEMHTFSDGRIAVMYSDGVLTAFNKDTFNNEMKETPPVEKKFTPIHEDDSLFYSDKDFTKLDVAKVSSGLNTNTTCILEHHKIDGVWKFIKAHQ